MCYFNEHSSQIVLNIKDEIYVNVGGLELRNNKIEHVHEII